MMQVGRVCLKIAGRDAGQHAVILSLDKKIALVDGQVRRRKCNVSHLEPLSQVVDIAENASHEQVVAALKGLGIDVVERKPRAKTEKPVIAKPVTPVVEKSKKSKK